MKVSSWVASTTKTPKSPPTTLHPFLLFSPHLHFSICSCNRSEWFSPPKATQFAFPRQAAIYISAMCVGRCFVIHFFEGNDTTTPRDIVAIKKLKSEKYFLQHSSWKILQKISSEKNYFPPT